MTVGFFHKARLIMNYIDNWYSVIIKTRLFKSTVPITIRDKKSREWLTLFPKNLLTYALLRDAGWEIVYSKENKYYYLSNKDVNLKSDISGLLSTYEIFVEKVYGENFGGKTVIDVGANNGNSSIFFALHGAKNVISLEPCKETYQIAIENIEMNKLNELILLLNVGLSDFNGSAEIRTSSKNSGLNSLANAEILSSKPKNIQDELRSSQFAQIITLEELIEETDLDHFDLFKLDCEGCEYKIITPLNVDSLKKFDEIIMEYHDLGPESIAGVLETAGFEITSIANKETGYLRAVMETKSLLETELS